MKRSLLQIGHWMTYLLLLVGLVSLQTSLWPLLLGHFPPLFWLVPFIYIGVYFPTLRAFAYVISLAFLLSFASSAPPFLYVFSLGLLTALMAYARRRVFWSGPTYLMLAVLAGTLLYPILIWSASQMAEPHPLEIPSFLAWAFQVLLTPWLAVPLYKILGGFDRLILPEGIFRETGVSTR